MRKIGRILMGLACGVITSCGDMPNNQSDNINNNEQAESPLGRELTAAEKRGMKLMKSRQESKRRTVSDRSNNKTSTYRYLATSDEYPIFSNLVKKSGVNKYMHSNDVTVLAPTDEAFENFPQYKDLLLPGNEAALNEFISYHIVIESLEYKAFSDGDSWTVHAGPTLELSKEGGIYFGGAHVRSACIETDKGSIIGMDDIIFFPEFEE